MSAPVTTCPRCTTVLQHRGTHSYCPRCVVQAALSLPTAARLVEGSKAPAPEEIAPLFPDFEIFQLLGAGGMGLVYEACQKNLDRLVALKLLPDDPATVNAEFSERFEREARSLARLNHSDVVQVYDQGRVEGWFYIAMELVPGLDLARILRRDGPLAPARAIALFTRLCHTLAEAHRLGIVHRDLKPANLLLERVGESDEALKVADFGLAKLLDQPETDLDLTADQTALGTPNYMAPEQREGGAQIDQRADIYALGVVFYEMLTGELPAGRFKPPSELAAVNPAIDAVIFKAMQPDPGDRYASVPDLIEALDRAKRKPLRRRTVLIPVAVALLLAVLAIAIWRPVAPPDRETGAAPAETNLDFDWSHAITIAPPHRNEAGYFGTFTAYADGLLVISAPAEGNFADSSDLPGRVHIYRFDEERAPELLTTLRAPNPQPNDIFGKALDLSSDGRVLCVSANHPESSNSLLYLYERRDEDGREWTLLQTLEPESEFSAAGMGIRAFLSGPWLAVSSPDLPAHQAVRLYHRKGATWNYHSTLNPTAPLNHDSHFGFQCRFHDGQLFVSGHRATSDGAHRAGAITIFTVDQEGEWQELQHLAHPSSTMLSYFGLDWTFPTEDRLAVGAFSDGTEGIVGGGRIYTFQRDPATGRWTPEASFGPPDPIQGPAAFGQQVAADGDGLLAVFAVEGSRREKNVSSLAHLFRAPDQASPEWHRVLRVRALPGDPPWLGRIGFTRQHLIVPSPQAPAGDTKNSGVVYLLPRAALQGE